jgi:hypothetical protein
MDLYNLATFFLSYGIPVASKFPQVLFSPVNALKQW